MSNVFTRNDVGEPEDQGRHEQNDGTFNGALPDILRRLTSLEQSLTAAPCQSSAAGDQRGFPPPGLSALFHNEILENPPSNGKHSRRFYEFSWGPELPVGKEFLLRLPDLFDLPHVKIDTSALLVYYNVLLQGLFMDRGLGQRRKDYASYMYRKLLEHAKDWDFEAQPTPTDLYAALLLVRCAVIMNRNIYSTDSNPVKDFCNKLVFR
ncbi:unnamed protein product [Aspergillus oryzae var. brunneus]|uniref:Unnamed protein product n=2 Tax=Aspergillus oryzae TaxID=5062 RepID=A0AAN4YRK9_ASPOZ|nr:unnamed protein product [Aspergillus oryzae]GMG45737.1 unnamed protein product [Aspergillus oryzae var. brunneus]